MSRGHHKQSYGNGRRSRKSKGSVYTFRDRPTRGVTYDEDAFDAWLMADDSSSEASQRSSPAKPIPESSEPDNIVILSGDEDSNENVCHVCENPGMLVCCSFCPKSYHTDCLVPKLLVIPEGDFACPTCLCASCDLHKHASTKETPVECSGCGIGIHDSCRVQAFSDVMCASCSLCHRKEVSKVWTWRQSSKASTTDTQSVRSARQNKHWQRREFYVQFRDRSHIHDVWLPEWWLVRQFPVVLARFLRKELEAAPVNDVVPPQWRLVDRVIAVSKDRKKLYIKWRGQGYEHCSWELKSNLKDCHEFRKPLQGFLARKARRSDGALLCGLCDASSIDITCTCCSTAYCDDHVQPSHDVTIDGQWVCNACIERAGKFRKTQRSKERERRRKWAEYFARKAASADTATLEKLKREEKEKKHAEAVRIKNIRARPPPGMSTRKATNAGTVQGEGFVLMRKQPTWVPEGLQMHKHQLIGVNFLERHYHANTSCILADEMGLGKTVQSIGLLGSHPKGPHLVVAPLITLGHWENEIRLWAPHLNVVVYNGTKEAREIIRRYEFGPAGKVRSGKDTNQRTCHFNVLLTSYDIARLDMTYLARFRWDAVVVDEGHRLKRADSCAYESLSTLKRHTVVLLTGTPIQNSLVELVTLMKFIGLKGLPEITVDSKMDDTDASSSVIILRERLKPHMIRRTKGDVNLRLPKKAELLLPVSMSHLQRVQYRDILERNYASLALQSSGRKAKSRLALINIMSALLKTVNHPYLFPDAEPSVDDKDEEYEKLIAASAKLRLMDAMLCKLKARGHRVLIFSQMTSMLDILEDYVMYRGWQYARMDGSTPQLERQELLDAYNAPGSPLFIFLMSTRACQLGINVATADTIFMYDSSWNPHNDMQAFARSHRIGQTRNVIIYIFVTHGSIEERVMQVARKKLLLEHAIMSKDVDNLDDSDLASALRHGAQALFTDEAVEKAEGTSKSDVDPDAGETHHVYDDTRVDQLLDRDAIIRLFEAQSSEQAGTATMSAKESFLAGFKFSTHWDNIAPDDGDGDAVTEAAGSGADGQDDADDDDDDAFWQRLLAQRLAKAEQERLLEETRWGKGRRTRTVVNYGQFGDDSSDLDEDDADADFTLLDWDDISEGDVDWMDGSDMDAQSRLLISAKKQWIHDGALQGQSLWVANDLVSSVTVLPKSGLNLHVFGDHSFAKMLPHQRSTMVRHALSRDEMRTLIRLRSTLGCNLLLQDPDHSVRMHTKPKSSWKNGRPLLSAGHGYMHPQRKRSRPNSFTGVPEQGVTSQQRPRIAIPATQASPAAAASVGAGVADGSEDPYRGWVDGVVDQVHDVLLTKDAPRDRLGGGSVLEWERVCRVWLRKYLVHSYPTMPRSELVTAKAAAAPQVHLAKRLLLADVSVVGVLTTLGVATLWLLAPPMWSRLEVPAGTRLLAVRTNTPVTTLDPNFELCMWADNVLMVLRSDVSVHPWTKSVPMNPKAMPQVSWTRGVPRAPMWAPVARMDVDLVRSAVHVLLARQAVPVAPSVHRLATLLAEWWGSTVARTYDSLPVIVPAVACLAWATWLWREEVDKPAEDRPLPQLYERLLEVGFHAMPSIQVPSVAPARLLEHVQACGAHLYARLVPLEQRRRTACARLQLAWVEPVAVRLGVPIEVVAMADSLAGLEGARSLGSWAAQQGAAVVVGLSATTVTSFLCLFGAWRACVGHVEQDTQVRLVCDVMCMAHAQGNVLCEALEQYVVSWWPPLVQHLASAATGLRMPAPVCALCERVTVNASAVLSFVNVAGVPEPSRGRWLCVTLATVLFYNGFTQAKKGLNLSNVQAVLHSLLPECTKPLLTSVYKAVLTGTQIMLPFVVLEAQKARISDNAAWWPVSARPALLHSVAVSMAHPLPDSLRALAFGWWSITRNLKSTKELVACTHLPNRVHVEVGRIVDQLCPRWPAVSLVTAVLLAYPPLQRPQRNLVELPERLEDVNGDQDQEQPLGVVANAVAHAGLRAWVQERVLMGTLCLQWMLRAAMLREVGFQDTPCIRFMWQCFRVHPLLSPGLAAAVALSHTMPKQWPVPVAVRQHVLLQTAMVGSWEHFKALSSQLVEHVLLLQDTEPWQ